MRITTKATSICVEVTVPRSLLAKLERARTILRERTIVAERTDGCNLSFTGADFSYGVGTDINEAEFLLKWHKASVKREER